MKHIFDEKTQQLEPTGTLCEFCGTNQCEDKYDNYYVTLYNEQNRTNLLIYRSVKFHKIIIGIPRCNSCLGVHQKVNSKTNVILWCIAFCLVLSGALLYGFIGFFISILISVIIALIFHSYIKNLLMENTDILSERKGAEQNTTVQDFIIEGWTFTKPSA